MGQFPQQNRRPPTAFREHGLLPSLEESCLAPIFWGCLLWDKGFQPDRQERFLGTRQTVLNELMEDVPGGKDVSIVTIRKAGEFTRAAPERPPRGEAVEFPSLSVRSTPETERDFPLAQGTSLFPPHSRKNASPARLFPLATARSRLA
jgi:hypothetical protein